MNRKNLMIIIVISVIILGVLGFSLYFKNQNNNTDNNIPNDYIAIFHGDAGEVTYSTYVYKIDQGFKYINTTDNTTSWGSSEWETKIISKGEVTSISDVFSIAKDNNAYSYVTLPNDTKTYSVEEFKSMFLED